MCTWGHLIIHGLKYCSISARFLQCSIPEVVRFDSMHPVFLQESSMIPAAFPRYSCSAAAVFLQHFRSIRTASPKIPVVFLQLPCSIPAAFPRYSCRVPAVFLQDFRSIGTVSPNIPVAFLYNIPAVFPQLSIDLGLKRPQEIHEIVH